MTVASHVCDNVQLPSAMYLTSLIILLLPVEICPEWVEISQLTYRKPFTTFYQRDPPTTPVRASIHKVHKPALEVLKVRSNKNNVSKIEDVGSKDNIMKGNVTSASRPPAPVTDNKNATISNNDKYNNVVKLLTLVADTISKHTTTNIDSKLNYLHRLQRSLLNDIGELTTYTIGAVCLSLPILLKVKDHQKDMTSIRKSNHFEDN